MEPTFLSVQDVLDLHARTIASHSGDVQRRGGGERQGSAHRVDAR